MYCSRGLAYALIVARPLLTPMTLDYLT